MDIVIPPHHEQPPLVMDVVIPHHQQPHSSWILWYLLTINNLTRRGYYDISSPSTTSTCHEYFDTSSPSTTSLVMDIVIPPHHQQPHLSWILWYLLTINNLTRHGYWDTSSPSTTSTRHGYCDISSQSTTSTRYGYCDISSPPTTSLVMDIVIPPHHQQPHPSWILWYLLTINNLHSWTLRYLLTINNLTRHGYCDISSPELRVFNLLTHFSSQCHIPIAPPLPPKKKKRQKTSNHRFCDVFRGHRNVKLD